jgi:aldose 1-epimerase
MTAPISARGWATGAEVLVDSPVAAPRRGYVAVMGTIRPVSGEQWQLASGDQRAVVVEVGGGLRSYAAGDWEIIDGYSEDVVAPGAAGHILAPWPNRVRDGRYTFGGQAYALPLSEPDRHNASHGLVRWLPWQAVSTAPERVELTCLLPAQAGYPWNVRLMTAWSIGPDGLCAEHSATNLSASACPFGLGAHPYLRLPSSSVDDTVITLPAPTRLETDDRLLPAGRTPVAGSAYDFREGRPVGTVQLDCAFTDLDQVGNDRAGNDQTFNGQAVNAVELASRSGGYTARVWADDAFRWWQLFTGDTLPGERRRRSIAVAPMTCPADAFRSGSDLITLEPGATWRAAWGISPKAGTPAV